MSCVTVDLTNITTCNRHKKHPDSDPQFVDNRKCCLSLSAEGNDYYVIRATIIWTQRLNFNISLSFNSS